jgi:hypothetical protein
MKRRRFALPLAAAALLMACAGWLRAQGAPSVKAVILRQIDKSGPARPSEIVRTADYAVFVRFDWSAPLPADSEFTVKWLEADGTPVLDTKASIKAGNTFFSTGLLVKGKKISTKTGGYRAQLVKSGESTVQAEAAFKVEEPTKDPNRPKFTVTMGTDAVEGRVTAKGNRFITGSRAVWVAMETETPAAKGHAYTAKVLDSAGEVVLSGAPIETNGTSASYATGFFIAGKTWAKSGGSFRMVVMWDDDLEPVCDLPFTIEPGSRYALLIGIKDYPPAGPENDLPGCDRDVAALKSYLTGPLGMPEQNITVLADLAATKAAIEKAITDLAAKAGPEDAVIITYSGHGAQVPDLDGDEEDGWDEAIVPAENLPPLITTENDLNRMITDDRLAELLRGFKTKNVTIIFDSCHSGTALRAGEDEAPEELVHEKFRKFDWGRGLMRKRDDAMRRRKDRMEALRCVGGEAECFRTAQQDDAGKQGGTMVNDGQFVFLASSRPWETSGCTSRGGFFTLSLLDALRNSDGENWRDILAKAREGVANFRPGQCPGVEGQGDRLPFSLVTTATNAAFARPVIAVVGATEASAAKSGEKNRQLDEGSAGRHKALLEAYSSAYMELSGGIFDVYPKSDSGFTGKPIGRVKLTGDRETVALVGSDGKPFAERLYATGEILSGTVHRGDRMVAAAIPVSVDRPKIGVSQGRPSDADKPKVDAAARALFDTLKRTSTVQLMERGTFADMDYVIQPMVKQGELSLYIWSPGGWKMANFSGEPQAAVDKCIAFITQRHRQATRVTRLHNPSAQFGLYLTPDGGDREYAPGEKIEVKLTATSDCWITVVPMNGNTVGTIVCFETQIKAGTASTFTTTLPNGVTGPQPLKIIATKEKLDASALSAAGPNDRAAALIRALQARVGNGGGGAGFLGADGWADTTLRFTLRK